MKVIFLCGGQGKRMIPLSCKYLKPLIPVKSPINGSFLPNIFNSMTVLRYFDLFKVVDEILVVADQSFFDNKTYKTYREEYMSQFAFDYCPITEVVKDWNDPLVNNGKTLEKALETISKSTSLKNLDGLIVLEGDIFLDKDLVSKVNLNKIKGESTYCCSYREDEWVFYKKDGKDFYEIAKSQSGLAMSGLSILYNEDSLIPKLYKELTKSPYEEFWDDALIRVHPDLNLLDVGDSIKEFDTMSDLIDKGLYTPEELAKTISDDFKAEPTSSMTNSSFVIMYGGTKSVIRFPGSGTDKFIDRDRETKAQEILNKTTLTPPAIIYPGGIKISVYSEGCRTSYAGDRDRVIKALSDFHKVSAPADLLVNLIKEITDYESLYDQRFVPSNYKVVRDTYFKLIKKYQHEEVVFCHRDLDPRNILVREKSCWGPVKRTTFVDFEYSGLLNKYWDFSCHLSEINHHFTHQVTSLEDYCESARRLGVVLDPQKMRLWEGIVDFVWACWTISKISLGEDYHSYFRERWNSACYTLPRVESMI